MAPHRQYPHEVRTPTLSADTSPDAERVQLEILRRMPSWKKAMQISEAIRTAHVLAESSLRDRYPKASEAEIHRRLMDVMLGEELARRVYGEPSW